MKSLVKSSLSREENDHSKFKCKKCKKTDKDCKDQFGLVIFCAFDIHYLEDGLCAACRAKKVPALIVFGGISLWYNSRKDKQNHYTYVTKLLIMGLSWGLSRAETLCDEQRRRNLQVYVEPTEEEENELGIHA